jgi:ferrous-iron efflux pump FieF
MTEETRNNRYARLVRLASLASVITATTLIVVKAGAWIATDSVSVLASLVDSLMDVVASLINFFAVRYALRPADEDHRFGHGKAESLAALGQATFIAGSALFLVLNALERFIHPRAIEHTEVGVFVMLFGVLMTGALLLLQRYVIRHTDSGAIRADALHYATDLGTNLATVAVLVASAYGYLLVDPLLACAIAIYVLRSAWQIGCHAAHTLMDQELGDAVQATIARLARETDGVLGVHDIRTRQSGPLKIIQLHLEMDREWSLERAHSVTKIVEHKILALYQDADVIIHQDPVTPALQ